MENGHDLVVSNKKVILKDYISGFPKESSFPVITEAKKLKLPEGASETILVKVLYIAIDPYQYIRSKKIDEHDLRSDYFYSYTPGSPVTSYAVSVVLESAHPRFKKGDLVWGTTGWEEYSIVKMPQIQNFHIIENQDVPLAHYLGILGFSGITAYVGMYELCSPKEGTTVFVSSAFGAVGQLVGQFAKLQGCYVVGSAGSKEKVELLKNKFGFDEAFNYKEEQNFDETLKRYFPDGIDIYFDNVGGKILDAVLPNMKLNGTIIQCGMTSQYTLDEPEGIKNLENAIWKRLNIKGIVITDYFHLFPRFLNFIFPLMKEEKIVYIEDIDEGIESCPSALVGLFHGSNLGRKIVVVARE